MSKTRILICPYCGETQSEGERCRGCGGLFEPLSRQATHNAMGPWFIRDPGKPFHPGCSYETLVRMIDRGQVTRTSIIRGPTTKQFWTVARRVPGVAHLLGYCPSCDARVEPTDHGCHACGVPFGAYLDRNYLGLPEVRPLPWEAHEDDASLDPAPSHADDLSAREVLTGGGLSGFASDEELLDRGTPAPASASASAPARQWTPPRPVPNAPPAGPADTEQATVFDESASAAVTRALRRKLASQQRMIRLMAFLAVLALLIAIIANLDALAGVVGLGGRPTPQATAPGGVAATSEGSAGARDAINEQDGPVTGQHSAQPESEPEPDTEPATPVPAPTTALPAGEPAAVEGADGSPEDAVLAAYAEALELVAAAGRGDRALGERIDDYKEALESLESLGDSLPTEQRPDDLFDQIEHIRQELERLQLKEFFG
jgi:hypothetical protein